MTAVALTWPGPPTLTDAVDGSTSYLLGASFTVPSAQVCSGLRWRVPDSVSSPPGGTHLARVYQDGALVRSQAFTPVPGGDQDILWTDQGDLACVNTSTYIAAVFTIHYTFRAGGGAFPVSAPGGVATSAGGRLATVSAPGDSPVFSADNTSIFFVSPLIGTADPAPPVLTGSLSLPALMLTGALTVEQMSDLTEPAHGFPLRAQLAEVLSTVSGMRGFPKVPSAPKSGDAWTKLIGFEHVAQGGWEFTWQIVIRLPQDDLAQDDWIVSRLDALTEALAPYVWIINCEVGVSADSPALLINCRE